MLRLSTSTRRRSFANCGASPRNVRGKQARPAATLADVDFKALRERMADTVERTKQSDPKELQRRIRELEQKLKDQPTPPPAGPSADLVNWLTVLRSDVGSVMSKLIAVRQAIEMFTERLGAPSPSSEHAAANGSPPRRLKAVPDVSAPSTAPVRKAPTDLGKGERTVLRAVAQHPLGCSREQLTILTGYKRSSRDTYLQRLRARGYVIEEGTAIVATHHALEALGSDYEPLPTGDALRSHWLERLPEGERRILSHLVGQYPKSVTRDALSELTGYKRSSRDTYLQRLSARRLVTNRDGEPRASDLLFD